MLGSDNEWRIRIAYGCDGIREDDAIEPAHVAAQGNISVRLVCIVSCRRIILR
jgi:hypothetical protein